MKCICNVAQYKAGKYVAADKEGDLHKRIFVVIVVGLRQSVPFLVQAIPSKVTSSGQWSCDKIVSNIENLGNVGFCVVDLLNLLNAEKFAFPEFSYSELLYRLGRFVQHL